MENQSDARDLTVTCKSMSESVYVHNCHASNISVLNKTKGITLTDCSRCCLVVTDVIGAVELVKCTEVTLLLKGTCHSIRLDRCSEITVRLNQDSCKCEIATYQTQNVNVSVPATGDREHHICDHWVTTYNETAKRLVTAPADSGAA